MSVKRPFSNSLQHNHSSVQAMAISVPNWRPSGCRSDPFFAKLTSGDVSGVQLLLIVDRGHVNSEDGRGLSPLICTQFLKDIGACYAITRILIYYGARHRHRDPRTGLDALGWACQLGRDVTVPLLLEHASMDIDFIRGQDIHGNSYLHLAARSGCREILCCIADAMQHVGLAVDHPRNHQGLSPFLFALKEGHEGLGEVLVNHYGAQPHQFDDVSHNDENWWRQFGDKNRSKKFSKKTKSATTTSPPVKGGSCSIPHLLALWAEQTRTSWRPPARPEYPVLLCLADQSQWSSGSRTGRKGLARRKARHSITDPVMPGLSRWRHTLELKRKQSLQIGHLGEQGRAHRKSIT